MQKIDLAFTYQFKDKEGIKKLLLGSLLIISCVFIIPIPVVVGYYLALQKNVMDKKENPMPEFTEFGELFTNGLKFMVALLGYSLPWVILIFFITLISLVAALIDEEALIFIVMLLALIGQAVLALYGLVILLVTPVLYIKGAQKAPWKSYYDFKGIYTFIKKNFVNIIIIVLLNWACGFIVNFGMIFLFIGIFPAAFYSGTVIAYLYGQLYLQAEK